MSTSSQPIFDRSKLTKKPSTNELARQILALRMVSSVSGFSTSKTILELLNPLPASELVALGEAFLRSEQSSEKAGE